MGEVKTIYPVFIVQYLRSGPGTQAVVQVKRYIRGEAANIPFNFPFGPVNVLNRFVVATHSMLGVRGTHPFMFWDPEYGLGGMRAKVYNDHRAVFTHARSTVFQNQDRQDYRTLFDPLENQTLREHQNKQTLITKNILGIHWDIDVCDYTSADASIVNLAHYRNLGEQGIRLDLDEFTVLLNQNDQVPLDMNMNPYIDTVMFRLAARIYKSLYVNQMNSVAVFTLMFQMQKTYGAHDATKVMGFQAHQVLDLVRPDRLSGMFLRVRLVKRPVSSANAEIMYIATAVTDYINKYLDHYEADTPDNHLGVRSVTINQLMYTKEGRFSPVIRAGPTVERLNDLISHSPDRLLRNQLKDFYNWMTPQRQLTSPKTRKNCFMMAIELCVKELPYENLAGDERVKTTKRVSARMKSLQLPEDCDVFTMMEKIGERNRPYLRGVKIFVRSISGAIVGTLMNAGIERKVDRHILVFAGHAFGVVPSAPTVLQRDSVLALPTPKPTDQGHTVGFLDIETTTTMNPYAIGLLVGPNMTNRSVTQFHGLQCVSLMMTYLSRQNLGDLVILYAHNAGRFDTPILMAFMPDDWVISKILEFGGSILSVTYFNQITGKSVCFRDSLPLIRGSLDELSRIYNVENPKLIGTVDHSLVTDESWYRQMELQPIREYLNNDVLALYQIVRAFRVWCSKVYSFDPVSCGILTGPSIAKNIFMWLYYDELEYPIYHLPFDQEEHIRTAYHGGDCSVMKRVHWFNTFPVGHPDYERLKYYDIVSMYPYEMVQFPLPYGDTIYETFDTLPPDWHGFVDIEFQGGNGVMNFFRMKHDSTGLVAPNVGTPQKVCVYSEELRFALEHIEFLQVDIRIIGGFGFKVGYFMRDITLRFYEMKCAAKTVSPAAYKAAKATLNSLYGHFGIRMWSKTLRLMKNKNEYADLLSTGHLVECFGDLAIVNDRLNAKIRSTAIAAAITSLAYITLFREKMMCYLAGHPVFYHDTDSIVTSMILPTGHNLGDWELEFGDIHEAVFVSRKIYALRNSEGDIVKIKGVSKGPYRERIDTETGPIFIDKTTGVGYCIKFEDIVQLLHPDKFITVKTFRVYGGRTRCMNRAGVVGERTEIKITGNMVSGNILENGDVVPLTIRFIHYQSNHLVCFLE